MPPTEIATHAPMRAPKQERSRRTLRRILEATEQLLEERLFEEVSVQDIVRRAGTSVGAFYTRFSNKEALLPALYERYDATMPDSAAEFELGPARDLTERVAQLVARTLWLFRDRRGLLRAMAIHARVNPVAIPRSVRERRRRLHRAIGDLLLEFRDEIAHPDPGLAVHLGLFAVSATFRDLILFGEAPHAGSMGRIPDRVLHREMSRVLLAYLKTPIPAPPSDFRTASRRKR